MVNQAAFELNNEKASKEAVRDSLIKRVETLTSELEKTAEQILSLTCEIEQIDDQIEALPPAEEKKE
jgi:prefoldin subunit 5